MSLFAPSLRPRDAACLLCLSLLGLDFSLASPPRAAAPDPARFPLRVYIFRYGNQPDRSQPRHPSDSDLPRYAAGGGQADLFQNGLPRAFQFTFSCTVPMLASAGHQTFPARWKKPEKTLEILLPQKGKPENLEPCELQLEWVPGLAYFWKNGLVAAGPPPPLIEWMKKHRFDPESDTEEPVLLPGDAEADDPFLAPE